MRVGRFDDRGRGTVAPDGKVNICGVLVHAAVGQAADLAARLSALEGVEVHATSDDGRLVVVVEDTETVTALDRMREFGEWKGVAASSLVFHQFEDAEAMKGEIRE